MEKNIWFTSDLHLGHKNILKHQVNRIAQMHLKDENDIEGHDKYIINMWNEKVQPNDEVYVLGDMTMGSQQTALHYIDKLKSKGCKIHLLVGNHDKSIRNMVNKFDSINLIKREIFKKNDFPFLSNDFEVIMSHYPFKSWEGKCRGSMQIYGHVHDNALWIDESEDLTFNVGLDNPICNCQLISLEELYGIYLKKLNGLNPKEYIKKITEDNKYFIR